MEAEDYKEPEEPAKLLKSANIDIIREEEPPVLPPEVFSNELERLYRFLIPNIEEDYNTYSERMKELEEKPEIIDIIIAFLPQDKLHTLEIINLLISSSCSLLHQFLDKNGFNLLIEVALNSTEEPEVFNLFIEAIKSIISSPFMENAPVYKSCCRDHILQFIRAILETNNVFIIQYICSLLKTCISVYTDEGYKEFLDIGKDILLAIFRAENIDMNIHMAMIRNVLDGYETFSNFSLDNKLIILDLLFCRDLLTSIFVNDYIPLKEPVVQLICTIFKDLIENNHEEQQNAVYEALNAHIRKIPKEFIEKYFGEQAIPEALPTLINLMSLIVKTPVTVSSLGNGVANDIRFDDSFLRHLIILIMQHIVEGSMQIKELFIEFLNYMLENENTNNILRELDPNLIAEFLDDLNEMYELYSTSVRSYVAKILGKLLVIITDEGLRDKIDEIVFEIDDDEL